MSFIFMLMVKRSKVSSTLQDDTRTLALLDRCFPVWWTEFTFLSCGSYFRVSSRSTETGANLSSRWLQGPSWLDPCLHIPTALPPPQGRLRWIAWPPQMLCVSCSPQCLLTWCPQLRVSHPGRSWCLGLDDSLPQGAVPTVQQHP